MATIDLQNRAPGIIRTDDFRNIIQRRYDVINWAPKSPVTLLAELWLPLGTTDEVYTDCYLIEQKIEGQVGDFYEPCKFPPVLLRTFEQLNGLLETQIGNPGYEIDQYDNTIATINWAQLSSGTATYFVPGVDSVSTPNGTALLMDEKRTDNGTLRTIQRIYTTGGQLSDFTEIKFGGKLKIRTLKYLGTATPPVISGYTLTATNVEYVRGLPVTSFVYAAGGGGGDTGTGGVISTEIEYHQSEDEGATGVTITTILYLTDLTVDSNPITPPADTVLISIDYKDEDGFRQWTGKYAIGTGMVVDDVDIQNNGKLYIYHRVALDEAPTAPSPTIGGTVTLIDSKQRNEDGYILYEATWAEGVGEISRSITYEQSENQGTLGVTLTTIGYLVAPGATIQPTSLSGSIAIGNTYEDRDGVRIWTTKWAKGTGLVAQAIHARQDGLREVTNISLGTRSAPSGVVIRDDYRLDEGFTVYTVTSIQSADGGTVTDATVVYERYVPFRYPGRAKAYFLTASNGWKAYDVFQSPPVSTDVKGTITVTYQTSDALGTISDYWNPTEWATIQAEWIGNGNMPGFALVALPGYRTTDDTPLTFTASVWEDGVAGTMMGNVVFGGTTAVVTVTGGPDDPGGSTFTLDATLEPAFTATDGTVYYRKTLVSAAIPTQADLPI